MGTHSSHSGQVLMQHLQSPGFDPRHWQGWSGVGGLSNVVLWTQHSQRSNDRSGGSLHGAYTRQHCSATLCEPGKGSRATLTTAPLPAGGFWERGSHCCQVCNHQGVYQVPTDRFKPTVTQVILVKLRGFKTKTKTQIKTKDMNVGK